VSWSLPVSAPVPDPSRIASQAATPGVLLDEAVVHQPAAAEYQYQADGSDDRKYPPT
jgi:hypothetical protein